MVACTTLYSLTNLVKVFPVTFLKEQKGTTGINGSVYYGSAGQWLRNLRLYENYENWRNHEIIGGGYPDPCHVINLGFTYGGEGGISSGFDVGIVKRPCERKKVRINF